jgi:hypothetical protein
MFQIFMDLSSDPLMIFYESDEIHTLLTTSSWAPSIDLNFLPYMSQILIDLSLDPLIMYLESDDIETHVI